MTIRLRRSTVESLKTLYPNGGYNRVVRALTDKHVRQRMSELTDDILEDESSDSQPQ